MPEIFKTFSYLEKYIDFFETYPYLEKYGLLLNEILWKVFEQNI